MAAYIGVLRLIARKRIADRQTGWGIQYHSAADWNERHNARRTGYVAEENKEELRNIARRVAIANMARKALNDPDNFKTFSGARRQYLVDIIDFVQQAPGRVKIKAEEGEVEHLAKKVSNVNYKLGHHSVSCHCPLVIWCCFLLLLCPMLLLYEYIKS